MGRQHCGWRNRNGTGLATGHVRHSGIATAQDTTGSADAVDSASGRGAAVADGHATRGGATAYGDDSADRSDPAHGGHAAGVAAHGDDSASSGDPAYGDRSAAHGDHATIDAAHDGDSTYGADAPAAGGRATIGIGRPAAGNSRRATHVTTGTTSARRSTR